MSEQKDMILENFLSSAIRTLDTDEIYNILMDSLILLLHPQGLLLTQNLNTGRSFCTVRRWRGLFWKRLLCSFRCISRGNTASERFAFGRAGSFYRRFSADSPPEPLACAAKYSCDQGDPVSAGCNRPFIYRWFLGPHLHGRWTDLSWPHLLLCSVSSAQCKPVSQCVSFFDHGQSHFLI